MLPYNEIVKLLNDIEHDLIEHEHVVTSEDAARVRGLDLSEGMKSLLLSADGEPVLVVLRGDNIHIL